MWTELQAIIWDYACRNWQHGSAVRLRALAERECYGDYCSPPAVELTSEDSTETTPSEERGIGTLKFVGIGLPCVLVVLALWYYRRCSKQHEPESKIRVQNPLAKPDDDLDNE